MKSDTRRRGFGFPLLSMIATFTDARFRAIGLYRQSRGIDFDGSPRGYAGGHPFKVVDRTTEGSSTDGAFSEYRSTGNIPHFTVDDMTIYQHVDTDEAASALKHPPGTTETNRSSTVQIELVGFAGRPKSAASLKKYSATLPLDRGHARRPPSLAKWSAETGRHWTRSGRPQWESTKLGPLGQTLRPHMFPTTCTPSTQTKRSPSREVRLSADYRFCTDVSIICTAASLWKITYLPASSLSPTRKSEECLDRRDCFS
jgi:hypothetical protein